MKKNISLIFVIFVLFFADCRKDETPDSSSDKQILLEQTVEASSSNQTISLPGKITIEIPASTLLASGKLRISELSSDIPKSNDDFFKVVSAYEIVIEGQTTFKNPLKVTFPLDATYQKDRQKRLQLQSAFYDKEAKIWSAYANTKVDTVKNTIQFETMHLTPLGLLERLTSGFYTDKYLSKHYNIYFVKSGTHAVPVNTEYNDKISRTWHKDGYPNYVMDAAYYLEYADSIYRKVHKLPVPERINVYIKNTGGDGIYGEFSGCIYLSNKIVKDIESSNITDEQYLSMSTAHELFHLVQDSYYSFLFAGTINLWWLEAMATNADAIVYKNRTSYETMMYFRKKLEGGDATFQQHINLVKSWDDCSINPAYYLAGNFLFYLSKLRPGTKLDLIEMMKNLGDPSLQLLYRHSLNKEIQRQIPSTDISKEYENYVKYLAECKNPELLLIYPPVSVSKLSTPAFPCFGQIFFASNDLKKSMNQALPYLSTKIVRLSNFFDTENIQLDVKFSVNKGTANVYLLDQNNTIVQELINDMVTQLDFAKKTVYHLLIINSNNLSSSEVTIDAEMKKPINAPFATGDFQMYVGAFKRFCPSEWTNVPNEYIPGDQLYIPVTIAKGGIIDINMLKTWASGEESCKGSGTITPTTAPGIYRFTLNFKWERKEKFGGDELKPFFAFETKTDVLLNLKDTWLINIKTPITGTLTMNWVDLDNISTRCTKEYTFSTFYLMLKM